MYEYGARKSRAIEYLILANGVMFILTLAAPRLAGQYLALTPAYVLSQPWTIITSMFVHADFWHIFFNMFFGLYMFGMYLENIIGEREFLKVYFAGGIAAGIFYVLLSLLFGLPNPLTSAVGASGAIYAIIGTLMVLRPNMPIYFYLVIKMPLWLFGSLYFLYSLLAVPTGLSGNIAVTAHVGGLIAGLIFGQIYRNMPQKPQYTYVQYY